MEVAKILTPSESDQESQPSSELFSQQKCETSSSPNSSPEENGIFQGINNNNNSFTSELMASQFVGNLAKFNTHESLRWFSERSNNFISDIVQQQLEKRLLQIETQNAQIHRHIIDLTASLVRLEGFLENSGILTNSLKRKFSEENSSNIQQSNNQNTPRVRSGNSKNEFQEHLNQQLENLQQGYQRNNQIQKNLSFIMDFIGQNKFQASNNNGQMAYPPNMPCLRNPILNFLNNNFNQNDDIQKEIKSDLESQEKEYTDEDDTKKRNIKEILSKFSTYLNDQNQGNTQLLENQEKNAVTNSFPGINHLLSSNNLKINRSDENGGNKSKKWDENRPYRNTTNQRQDEPVMILNPIEPREMFVGGVHPVRLPVWAYRKCLGMVRGAPHELGPRLCLRLLQSLFSLNYLVTHNYNGSGGKTPIDPTVMSAVLQQAQLQFGSDHFFTEPMALGKLRDYLNNAFRVMAFRQRKGERVRSPFWNEDGEPVLPLDPPAGYNISGKNTTTFTSGQTNLDKKYLKSDLN